MEDSRIFLNHINDNYSSIQTKIKMLCGRNHMRFDEDAMQEVIIRCYNAIVKKGYLNDKSPYGIESYLIKSYFNLLKEIKRSCNISKRDMNYNSDNIGNLYEDWYNTNNSDVMDKIKGDLYKDFSVLYILNRVEDNFDNEHFYLFRMKQLIPCMTYKRLQDITNMKAVRQKVVEVKRWLKDNVTKEEINKAFYVMYGDLL